MTPKFLTTAEAAIRYQIPERTLTLWREKRRGPNYYRVSKRVLYKTSDFDDFIESCAVEPYSHFKHLPKAKHVTS